MNEGRRTEKFPALLLLWHIPNQQKITQAATISFPKGVNASPASLKCWIPKGMPIMVMHSNNPNPKCERQIQMPPKNIQRIFIST